MQLSVCYESCRSIEYFSLVSSGEMSRRFSSSVSQARRPPEKTPGEISLVSLFCFQMDLQRRGQQKGRVYWRCYFNAVTCF